MLALVVTLNDITPTVVLVIYLVISIFYSSALDVIPSSS
nr:MAG TPA: hypothetical protein [Bacteriophage sp.]